MIDGGVQSIYLTHAIYYEGGEVDRHWIAPRADGHPSGLLGLTEARERRVSRYYKTREAARRKMEAMEMERRRA
jgi:ribosomal protein S15P/S13E